MRIMDSMLLHSMKYHSILYFHINVVTIILRSRWRNRRGGGGAGAGGRVPP